MAFLVTPSEQVGSHLRHTAQAYTACHLAELDIQHNRMTLLSQPQDSFLQERLVLAYVQPSAHVLLLIMSFCLQILVRTRYHRIYVTSEDRRPCGIITLTDILRLIAGRHLSLPSSPPSHKAGPQPGATRAPRRSMSQPAGMEAFRQQEGLAVEPLRAVQTAPHLDLTNPQSSGSDYIGQLLELELLRGRASPGSEAESVLQAMRALSPAPAASCPAAAPSAASVPLMGLASPGATPKEVGHHTAAPSVAVVDNRLAAVDGMPEVTMGPQIPCRPSPTMQPIEDEVDVTELMTFDDNLLLLPLPENLAGQPDGRKGLTPRRPLRTESSPCSMAEAFPSLPDMAALADSPEASITTPMAGDWQSPLMPGAAAEQQEGDGAQLSTSGEPPLYFGATGDPSGTEGDKTGGGPSGPRSSSPWHFPWYFGKGSHQPPAGSASPGGPTDLDRCLAESFLSDSVRPGSSNSRPAAAVPLQPNPAAISVSVPSTSFPGVPGEPMASLSGGLSGLSECLLSMQGPNSHTSGCSPLGGEAETPFAGGVDGPELSSAARCGSLPCIADLQLGSPQGSSGDLHAMTFASSPPAQVPAASSASRRLSSGATTRHSPFRSPGGRAGSPNEGLPDNNAQREAALPKSPPEARGKDRQQHIFSHEPPPLSVSSRRKWCKVSSDGSLSSREQLA